DVNIPRAPQGHLPRRRQGLQSEAPTLKRPRRRPLCSNRAPQTGVRDDPASSTRSTAAPGVVGGTFRRADRASDKRPARLGRVRKPVVLLPVGPYPAPPRGGLLARA